MSYRRYTGWNLFWDVVLTLLTAGLWFIVIIIRFLGRNS